MSLSGAGIYSEVYIKIPGSSFNPFLRPFRSLATTGNSFTLRFNSDGATTRSGYALEWSCPTASINETTTPDFSIYPNPTDDHLYIVSNGNRQVLWSAELYDVQGKLIRTAASVNGNRVKLTVFHCRQGIYILKVKTAYHIHSFKVLISR